MRTRKLKKKLEREFGKEPEKYYFHGDMEYIRTYYDYRLQNERDEFLIDDITWNDLDMDDLFKRINIRLSTSGEQYLYYMLRSPAIDNETYQQRKSLIDYMGSDDTTRLKLEVILAKLGCTRRADMCRAFSPKTHRPWMLYFYLLMLLLLPLAALSILFLGQAGMLALIAVAACNGVIHELEKRKVERDFDTVNYSVSMIFALNKIRKMHNHVLDGELNEAYTHLDRLQSVIRTGGVVSLSDNGGPGDLLTTFLLLDLITYEFLKNKLGKCSEDVFSVHENLGRIEAAIAIASYRRSLDFYSEPELTFESKNVGSIQAIGVCHPLIDKAVPNDLQTEKSVLITGSNASGKSTYLRATALSAVMAQSICTCIAKSYHASAFRVYSSMALKDNLFAGESYYIVESKSLKRIIDHIPGTVPVLCIIDEVLRGTNTVERIAASCEVLRAIAGTDAICIAASHDIELCDLLKDAYSLAHFEETILDDEMVFDYKIRPGKATSRNAINLLKLIGFPEEIVTAAHERADHFVSTGIWDYLTT